MANVKSFARHHDSFPTRNDLPAETRRKMVAMLDQQLADSFDLQSQLKQAHWNVKGPQFIALHKLFDKLAEGLGETIDEIAERATALGGVVHGTVRMAAQASRLPDFPANAFAGEKVLKALADRYALLAASSREAIDTAEDAEDKTTADLFNQVSADVDKALWFLEAHLEDGK